VDAAAAARVSERISVCVRTLNRKHVIVELEAADSRTPVTGRADPELIAAVGGDAAVAAAAVPADLVEPARRQAVLDVAPHRAAVAGIDDADDEVESPLRREAEPRRRRALAVEVHGARLHPCSAEPEAGSGRSGCGGAGAGEHQRRDDREGAESQEH
jgi:hypothetical protein